MTELPKTSGEADFFNEKLTPEEKIVYDRQFRLEGWHQEILKESRVLIVGVGGLGCEIAKNLAMVGVGHLDLVDLDTIEHSNLNRQVLFVNANVGESKAVAAARELKKINPTIFIVGHHCALEQLDPLIFKQADLIVGGLDSVRARRNLNAHAVRFKKPLVDGGVSGYHGHIYTTFPYENACYECNPTRIAEVDDMNACTVVGVPRKRSHCLLKANMTFKDTQKRDPNPKSEADIEILKTEANRLVMTHNFPPEFTKSEVVKMIDRHEPGIITINAVIASIQSHEAIKILNWLKGNQALGEPQKEYVIYNGTALKFYWMPRPRNANCPQCGPNVRREEISISPNVPAKAIIDQLAAKGFEPDPEMAYIISKAEFGGIKEIELEQTANEAGLRAFDLVSVAGFKGGSIAVTILFQ